MTLGTAKIETSNGLLTLTYVGHGSFLEGRQTFGDGHKGWNAALRFCRERSLQVIETPFAERSPDLLAA